MEASQSPASSPLSWLEEREKTGTTSAEALAFYDSLPPVGLDELIGRWKGSGLPTGHPLDDLLVALGWYGKEFLDAEQVHPLLVEAGGKVFPITSRFLPMSLLNASWLRPGLVRALFALVRPLLRTKAPTARLRMLEFRGKLSAAMLYDFLPINDNFRRVDQDTLLGLMDLRGIEQPFFFAMRRVSPAG